MGQKSQTLFPLFCCSSGVATSLPGLHMQAELCRTVDCERRQREHGKAGDTGRLQPPNLLWGGKQRSHSGAFCLFSQLCVLLPSWPALPEHSKANVFRFNLFCLSKSPVLLIRGAGKVFSDPDVSWATGFQTDRDDPRLGCSGAGTQHWALPAHRLCLVPSCPRPVSPIALSSALFLAPSGALF